MAPNDGFRPNGEDEIPTYWEQRSLLVREGQIGPAVAGQVRKQPSGVQAAAVSGQHSGMQGELPWHSQDTSKPQLVAWPVSVLRKWRWLWGRGLECTGLCQEESRE